MHSYNIYIHTLCLFTIHCCVIYFEEQYGAVDLDWAKMGAGLFYKDEFYQHPLLARNDPLNDDLKHLLESAANRP